MRLRKPIVVAAFGLISTACGAAGGPNGGGDHLPNRGIGPWEKVEETPTLTPPQGTTWANPAALTTAAGVDLYFEVQSNDTKDIVRASADAAGETFGEATTILAEASQPAVTRGPDGKLWLAWVEGDDDIRLGTLEDGQVELQHSLAFNGTSPAVVFKDDVLHVFFVDDAEVRISRRNSAGIFSNPAVVLAAGVDCLDSSGEATACWDADGIVDIDVRLGRTAAGRDVFRLFYTGRKGNAHAFGFAASYDSRSWERYAFNPVFSPGNGGRSPSPIVSDDRYLMYYADRTAKALRLGVLEPSAVSETW